MERCAWLLILCLFSTPAWCQDDIVDVLRRSQDLRLQALTLADADGERAATVQRSFGALLQALQPTPSVELRVIRGPVVAETLHGHIIVANESLAEMPEAVRLFILAHEIGHVAQQHWLRTAQLYQKWIPGPVTPDQTDPVASRLGHEASVQAHQQEFAADAYAAQLLRAIGRSDDDLMAVFQLIGATQDTATHPATRKRIASLRALALMPTSDAKPSTH